MDVNIVYGHYPASHSHLVNFKSTMKWYYVFHMIVTNEIVEPAIMWIISPKGLYIEGLILAVTKFEEIEPGWKWLGH